MSTDEIKALVIKWHNERTERLRTNERSWFGLAGLFWLKQGQNTFGSDSSCDFVLPEGAPKKAGVFIFQDGQVTVEANSGVKITCNGGDLPSHPLRDDQQEEPDYLYLNNFVMVVLKRGKSTLIRLWDSEHPARKALTKLDFYPYNKAFCIQAKYVGYAPSKPVTQKDIIGEVSDIDMIGYVVLEWEGKEYHLDAEDAGDGLFIAFRDTTNAKNTYAGGRYLLTERPRDGQIMIDFNRAYSPPCAYTVFATCTLPSTENRLPFKIEAGEKKYHN